jgi:isopropylmalate/homocitrate/citramalate synthase
VLVPNERGLDRAEAAGADAVAVFTAASEAFTQANIGMTIDGSLAAFAPVLGRAGAAGWWRRGYLSTAFGCPYSGDVATEAVVDVARRLVDLGCDEVSIGDTIGVAYPDDVRRVITALLEHIPADRLALHLHDTYGRALANVEAGLELGIRTFDSSAGGTGGCPYAPGAPGNLATEALCQLLDRLGYTHGVDAVAVAQAAHAIQASFARP